MNIRPSEDNSEDIPRSNNSPSNGNTANLKLSKAGIPLGRHKQQSSMSNAMPLNNSRNLGPISSVNT
jgi:hypothetical protein